MLRATLLTIAKTWNQRKRPLTEEWIEMWYIHTMDDNLAIEKNEKRPSAAPWMDSQMTTLVK